ncbi:HNH endonuclease signature motif containing protein, partial [Cellulomonas composti]|uniref:HNH endonuclease signature motif containing protein n=1 Tax=Cellulomonas composti TaxID=266130 RepID=UPI0011BEFB1B
PEGDAAADDSDAVEWAAWVRAAVCTVDPDSAAAVADGVDPDALLWLEGIAAADRLSGWLYARRALMAAALARHTSMSGHVLAGDRLAATEIAWRLGCSKQAAQHLVREGHAMGAGLQPTTQALLSGDLDEVRGRIVVRRLADVPWQVAELVQEQVLPGANRRTPTQLSADLERAIIAADAQYAAGAHREARRTRRVERPRALPDGMSSLRAVLPAETAAALDSVLESVARARRATGDPRTLDQLRADTLIDLTLGQDALDSDDPDLDAHGPAPAPFGAPTPPSTHADPPTTPTPRAGDPTPTNPTPANPASTDPEPSDPAPSDPAPANPASSDPASTDPASGDPAPTDPASGDPAPTDPASSDSAPTDPASTSSVPTDPASTGPAPAGAVSTGPAPAGAASTGLAPAGAASTGLAPAGAVSAGLVPAGAASIRVVSPGPASTGAVSTDASTPVGGDLAAEARRRRPRVNIDVVVSLETLIGLDDAPAELAGHGPISAAQARALARGGVWRRIVTDPLSNAVLDVGRTRYKPPADIEHHVRARDRQCYAPSCSSPAAGADLDHTIEFHPPPWAPDQPPGPTSADNLAPACRSCHTIKSSGAFRVTQVSPGVFRWRTPLGLTYETRPGADGWNELLGRGRHTERSSADEPPPF